MITKGAVDVLLPKIVKIETSTGIRAITEEHRKKIEEVNRDFSYEWIKSIGDCLQRDTAKSTNRCGTKEISSLSDYWR